MNFDIPCIFPQYPIVIDVGLEEQRLGCERQQNRLQEATGCPISRVEKSYLNVVFREFLGEGPAASSCRVHSIVYGDLAILVIEPGIDVLTALFEDLLA